MVTASVLNHRPSIRQATARGSARRTLVLEEPLFTMGALEQISCRQARGFYRVSCEWAHLVTTTGARAVPARSGFESTERFLVFRPGQAMRTCCGPGTARAP